MGEIKWEGDLESALSRARKEDKTVYLDFWFDG
jgi:hypothetical protein